MRPLLTEPRPQVHYKSQPNAKTQRKTQKSTGRRSSVRRLENLLAELVDDGLEDEHGSRGADDGQRLTGEHVVRDAADGSAHEALHRRLRATSGQNNSPQGRIALTRLSIAACEQQAAK